MEVGRKIAMEDCLFCKIAAKGLPAEVVHEDKNTIAFLDIHPKAPGHIVVIPKEHRQAISELADAEIGDLFRAVKKISRAVYGSLRPDGLNIGINEGTAAGQAVSHLHVHILPRFTGDGGTSIHGIVNNPPKESLEAIRKKIMNQKNFDV